MVKKIKEIIFCCRHSHTRFLFTTQEKAQILADGCNNPWKVAIVRKCFGCGKFYTIRKWTREALQLRKIMG